MLDEVLKRIKPTAEEKKAMEETCRRLLGILAAKFNDIHEDLTVEILGSVSRDTWLAHEKDIDVFVKFPKEFSKKELEDTVTLVGNEVLEKAEKRFAEHPYIRGMFDGYDVEIIPCYAVDAATKRVSAVDRTPFHDRFVRENLGGRSDEVRLLKQFLKGIGCYGAEARIEGFSGYLCELLVIGHGSFDELLQTASKWRPPLEISMDGRSRRRLDKRFSSPLVLLDPTDRDRNVASALSQERLSTFIYAAKEFLKRPRKTFFFPNKRKAEQGAVLKRFRDRGTHLITLNFKPPDVIEDILYTQTRKAVKVLERLLSDHDFTVIQTGFYADQRITIAFELQAMELPVARLHMGPPVNSENEKDFLKKHRASEKALSRPFIKDGRWMVFLKREHKSARELLEDFLSQSSLREKGIPGYIASEVEKGFSIKVGEQAIKENPVFYAGLVDPQFSWEV